MRGVWIRLFLQAPDKHDMDGPYSHVWMFDEMGGMLFGGLWMILVWLVSLLMIIALLKYLLGKPSGKGEPEPNPEQKKPLDILKDAYARGEIGRDEYLQKRQGLLEKQEFIRLCFRSLSDFSIGDCYEKLTTFQQTRSLRPCCCTDRNGSNPTR